MLKIGITGQGGFIGSHLYNNLGLYPEEFERVPFHRCYFSNPSKLIEFVGQCDVIVHLAAMNRHSDAQMIFNTNIDLTEKLINALENSNSKAHILFSSSIQEEKNNEYGNSKKTCRELLFNWSKISGGKFSGLIIPNVFGPFGQPNYNSVIATFCHQLVQNETPTIVNDDEMKLIYVSELVEVIFNEIRNNKNQAQVIVPFTSTAKVSQILHLLETYKFEYQNRGIIPYISSNFELNLFNTFRSYINIESHFPISFVKHTDIRGSFVEIIKLGIGGQVSFSSTLPGITRGNHYHTRKIERFVVIRGKALIQLRRIGTDEVLDFYLDGENPAYVDMPIWYTHNIKNIGDEVLFTNFWINEFYDPCDPDTYFEKV